MTTLKFRRIWDWSRTISWNLVIWHFRVAKTKYKSWPQMELWPGTAFTHLYGWEISQVTHFATAVSKHSQNIRLLKYSAILKANSCSILKIYEVIMSIRKHKGADAINQKFYELISDFEFRQLCSRAKKSTLICYLRKVSFIQTLSAESESIDII